LKAQNKSLNKDMTKINSEIEKAKTKDLEELILKNKYLESKNNKVDI